MIRILFNLILISSAVYLPLWSSLVLAVFFAFGLRTPFYEFIYIGFLLDIIYGSYLLGPLALPRYTLAGLVLLFVINFFKKRMNIYV